MIHIKNVDLNLLSVAASLYRHGNVSRAAQDLGLSQSAVSHALARLRHHFKDPLFVRVSKGVAPTDFTRSIEGDLLELVRRMEHLLNRKRAFEPREARGRVTLASNDYFEAVALSRLQPILSAESPLVQLSLRPTLGELPKRELEDGSIDLAVAGFYDDLPEGFYQMRLFTDTFACAVREGHALAREAKRRGLGLDAFFSARHALVTLQGDFRDRIEHRIGRKRLSREIAYGSYSFTGMAWVLASSDLLLTAPKRLLAEYARHFPIQVFDCPVDLGSIDVRMVWHARTHADPLRAWFRSRLKSVC